MKRTPLYPHHCQLNAKMVEFAGWEMPLHYGSQLNEHLAVRQNAGIFDVSHMGIIDIEGRDSLPFLRHLMANNPDKLKVPGKALYTCMLNEAGGILDDLIVYYLEPDKYSVIVNAGCFEKDWLYLENQARVFSALTLKPRNDLALLALQGPNAHTIFFNTFPETKEIIPLKPFSVLKLRHAHYQDDIRISTTGYTGELGFEIAVPTRIVDEFWSKFLMAGAKPIGLGARDSLRLEAGLNLYGSDMDETVTPLESNLAWTVAFDPSERDFIGRAALEKQKTEGIKKQLLAAKLRVRGGVLRAHQPVIAQSQPIGEITSGTFSPLLNSSIGFARIQTGVEGPYAVKIRDTYAPLELLRPPIWRREAPHVSSPKH